MSQVITAMFEDGLLKPEEALDLPPHTRVRVTVERLDANLANDDAYLQKHFGEAIKRLRLSKSELRALASRQPVPVECPSVDSARDSKFRLGDQIRFHLGVGLIDGVIVEDRGNIGYKGRHLWGINFTLSDPNEIRYTELGDADMLPAE